MKIISRLKLVMLLAVVGLLGIMVLFLTTVIQLERAKTYRENIEKIKDAVAAASATRDHYFLYQEFRLKDVWERRTEEIRESLNVAEQRTNEPSDLALIVELRQVVAQADSISRRIEASFDSPQRQAGGTADELQKRLLSQSLLKTARIDRLVNNIMNLSDDRLKHAYRRLLAAACFSAMLLAGLIVYPLFSLARVIRSRVTHLTTCVRRIGSGSLDYRLDDRPHDELGEVARAINEMLAQLVQAKAATEMAQAKMFESAKLASLGEMAAGIAHEINNPLSIVIGFCSLLRENLSHNTVDPEQLSASLRKIEATATRIAKIVGSMQSFSRDSTNDPLERINIKTLIDDTVELCSEKFRTHDIELRVHSTEAHIDCRPPQISQILMNLLNNAFDAVEALPEKWVEIQVMTKAERVLVSIMDSGLGIPENIAERIMQPFFTSKPVGKGTGLGLSISSQIAATHGGQLHLDRACAHTRFVLDLPIYSTL